MAGAAMPLAAARSIVRATVRRAVPAVVRLPQRLLIGLVLGYRLLLKPWLGNACRFEPSCSQYALDALRRHGALGGTAWAGARLLRCHPWCAGGFDPVPERLPGAGLFTRLIDRRHRDDIVSKKPS